MKRTAADGVWVWFWARNDPTVPNEVRYNIPSVIPNAIWGEPSARFVPDQCNMTTHFGTHNIVFDLTFCVSDPLTKLCSKSLMDDSG